MHFNRIQKWFMKAAEEMQKHWIETSRNTMLNTSINRSHWKLCMYVRLAFRCKNTAKIQILHATKFWVSLPLDVFSLFFNVKCNCNNWHREFSVNDSVCLQNYIMSIFNTSIWPSLFTFSIRSVKVCSTLYPIGLYSNVCSNIKDKRELQLEAKRGGGIT